MTAVTYPNETTVYRAARNALLEAEAELRDQTERVAAMRRELPPGGTLTEDYAFDELTGGAKRSVELSELFANGQDSLFLYGFMFGQTADSPCPLCTSFLDSLNANAPHITQQISMAVSARAPIDKLQRFADGRGWNNLRMVSSHGNSYQSDYHAEKGDSQVPMANVFVRRDGVIHHHWGSELLFAPSDTDSRHIDMMWPLWNVLDLTPQGRGGGWYPQLSYD
jgi:predicted dithiol-disulfide oxidoreductase (DUF899 family)